MRTLPASQVELASRAALAPVVLVHLRTFTDYTAATADADFYYSSPYPVLYPWNGGAAVTFDDAIRSVSAITRRMEHQPNGSLVDLRQTGVEIRLGNELDSAGASRWSTLRLENLPFAHVEIATLLVDPTRLEGLDPSSLYWDLRALPGTEHVYHFRGELTGIGTVTANEIPLTFETREPVLDWPFSSVAAEVDPRHLGRRYPIPVGRAKSVPVINRKVGWVTTLAQALTGATTGSILVTDATGIVGTGVEIQVGAERVLVDAVDATHVSITARAQSGTTAIAHNAGEAMVEILASNVLVFSGVEAKALDALYVISPLTGERVLVPSSSYTTTLADTTTDAGRTISSVSFTAAQFRALIDSLAAVSQQPGSSVVAVQVPLGGFVVVSPSSRGVSLDAIAFTAPDRMSIVGPGAGVDEHGRVWWESDAGIPNALSNVIRFRLVVRCQGIGGPGSGGLTTNPTIFRCAYTSIYGRSETFTLYTFDNGVSELGIVAATPWRTPSGTHTVDTISNPGGGSQNIDFWIVDGGGGGFWDNSHNSATFYVESSYLEVEIESDISDLALAALSLGFGLDFVADVQGAQTAGTLHESPPDVLEWFLETFAGLPAGTAEATSFAAAATNLGSNVVAGVLNLAGEGFGEVLARLCFEARANLVARETSSGTVYRLLAAEADFEWPAAVRTLDELADQTETEKSVAEQATRFRALYGPDLPPNTPTVAEDNFRAIVRIDPDQNDAAALLATAELEAAEDLWGRRDAELLFLVLVEDEATAEDVLAYYAHESIRRASRIGCTVPWDLGYDLELGDLVELTPRGHSGALKCRVIETVLDLRAPLVGLVLEEVP